MNLRPRVFLSKIEEPRADEYLQVLKKIWTDDVVEFKGRFYNIPASKIGPNPQKPHPRYYLVDSPRRRFHG